MPSPKSKFTAAELVPGQICRVVQAIRDYDGTLHPLSERWRFVTKNFLPYEDGLTLQVEQDGPKRSIRLRWREEIQSAIIDNFSSYVQ